MQYATEKNLSTSLELMQVSLIVLLPWCLKHHLNFDEDCKTIAICKQQIVVAYTYLMQFLFNAILLSRNWLCNSLS